MAICELCRHDNPSSLLEAYAFCGADAEELYPFPPTIVKEHVEKHCMGGIKGTQCNICKYRDVISDEEVETYSEAYDAVIDAWQKYKEHTTPKATAEMVYNVWKEFGLCDWPAKQIELHFTKKTCWKFKWGL